MEEQEYKELTAVLKASGIPLGMRKKLQNLLDTEFLKDEKHMVGVKECVYCGGNTLVINSRTDEQGHVVRVRACQECKRQYKTVKVLAPIESEG